MTLRKITSAAFLALACAGFAQPSSDQTTSALQTTATDAMTSSADAPASGTSESLTALPQAAPAIPVESSESTGTLPGGAAPKSPVTSDTMAMAVQTTATATTAPVSYRVNYDLVKPHDDATSKSYSEVTAVSENPGRDKLLAGAVIADDFSESTSATFVFYKGLTAGNESDPAAGGAFTSTRQAFPNGFGRQPAGPLSGRVIFCSAGHGWTNDNTSTTMWYTQRPETHGVVEDFGNLDQMNLYADICFRAGATIVPLRPIGYQHIERVIDNNSSHAYFKGSWADSQSTASFGFEGAKIPYRFARASAEETAVARFQPVMPVLDEYPVYAWARAGADRVNQTYRVVHAGGVTEVDVDHRRVGSGWVYLGSYVFRAGTNGYVEVTDKVRDAEAVARGGVVIADAIRFGNGMGDVNRGGGISERPREEEASRYWVERSLPAGEVPLYDAFANREDQSNNVGSAPRFAAYMNRETGSNFFDRLFLSFHSNAAGGRGVVGLYNSHAILRPDHQIALAKLTADELNAEMTSAGISLPRKWHVNRTRTDGHINFGEIRRDYINNEMSATIVEVAYHDHADDALLLRKLSVRDAVALSSYRATLRFFNEVGGANLPYNAPPATPHLLSVLEGPTSGTVVARWSEAPQDPLSSPTTEISYRVYQSPDGIGFDQGQDVGNTTSFKISNVLNNVPVYVRVAAVSPGGESRPSGVLGANLSNTPGVLVVQGAGTIANDTALTQTVPRSLGSALRDGGSFIRLVPRLMNNREQVRALGSGLRAYKEGFGSIDVSQFSTVSNLHPYRAVALMLGRAPLPEDLTTTDALKSLHDYVTSGGRLLISGGRLAESSAATTDSLERWGEFSEQVLQVNYKEQTQSTELLKTGEGKGALTTTTVQISNRNLRYFDQRPNEVLIPKETGRAVLAYNDNSGAAAIATLKDRLIRTIVIGFPLEEMAVREEQLVLGQQILMAMGLHQPEPAPKKESLDKKEASAKKSEIVIEDSRTTDGAAKNKK